MIPLLFAAILALTPDIAGPEPQPRDEMQLGAGVPWQIGGYTETLEALGNPIWYNWIYDSMHDPRFTPMLWEVNKDAEGSDISNWSDAIATAQQYPGRLWFLGNEPNFTGQSNTTPGVFADSVRTWQSLTDTRIAVAGVPLPNQQSLQWLSDYLDAGGPVTEYWHIHIYAGTPEQWAQTYRQFESWMAHNGVERPVIVTETSAASRDVGAQRAILEYLPHALRDFDSLDSVYWYAARDFQPNFANGDLLTVDNELTELGEHFVQVQAAGLPSVDYILYMPELAR